MAKATKKQPDPANKDSLLENENTSLQDILDTTSITFEGHPASVQEKKEEELETSGPKEAEKETAKPKGDKDKKVPEEVLSGDQPPKNPLEEGKAEKTPEERLSELEKENQLLQKRLKDTQTDFHTTRDENKKQREQ